MAPIGKLCCLTSISIKALWTTASQFVHLPCRLPAFAAFYVGHQTHMRIHTLSPSIHTRTHHFLHSHFVVRIDCSNYCFMTGGPVELMLAQLARVSLLGTFTPTVSCSPRVSCTSLVCRDPSIILTQFISASLCSTGNCENCCHRLQAHQSLCRLVWTLLPFSHSVSVR